jgi:hypothetical protein
MRRDRPCIGPGKEGEILRQGDESQVGLQAQAERSNNSCMRDAKKAALHVAQDRTATLAAARLKIWSKSCICSPAFLAAGPARSRFCDDRLIRGSTAATGVITGFGRASTSKCCSLDLTWLAPSASWRPGAWLAALGSGLRCAVLLRR